MLPDPRIHFTFFLTITFFLTPAVLCSNGILLPLPSCHNIFTEPEGVISSPNYPESYPSSTICNYDIARQTEDVCGVRVTFQDLDLETWDRDGFCKKDWISIHSCVPEGGNRFCGEIQAATTYEYAFQNEAEYFRIVFHSGEKSSNDSLGMNMKVRGQKRTRKGFQLKYKLLTDCRHGLYWSPPVSNIPGLEVDIFQSQCFTQVTESKGTINTPFFPRNYPNDMDCVYEFLRESPFVCGIRMRVLTFDLEDSIHTELGGACSDFFHLVGGCGFMCGRVRFVWIAKYQPGASSLKFHFHSDEQRTSTGFQIAFEQLYSC